MGRGKDPERKEGDNRGGCRQKQSLLYECMQLLKKIGTYSLKRLPVMQGKGPRIWLAELKEIATRITNDHANALFH